MRAELRPLKGSWGIVRRRRWRRLRSLPGETKGLVGEGSSPAAGRQGPRATRVVASLTINSFAKTDLVELEARIRLH